MLLVYLLIPVSDIEDFIVAGSEEQGASRPFSSRFALPASLYPGG